MPIVNLIKDDTQQDFDVHAVTIIGTLDEIEAGPGHVGGYVDTIAGYDVQRIQDAQHNGYPAKMLVLSAAHSQEEVGRITLRTDITSREMDLVTWSRQFEDPDARDKYLEQFNLEMQVPAGYRPGVLRQVGDGDVIKLAPGQGAEEQGEYVVDEIYIYPATAEHLLGGEQEAEENADSYPSGIAVHVTGTMLSSIKGEDPLLDEQLDSEFRVFIKNH